MKEERDPIGALIRESGLEPREYATVAYALDVMRDLVPAQAPIPSAELADLMWRPESAAVPHLARRGTQSTVVTSAALAVSLLVGGGTAAAVNQLPEPAQRLVADLSERLLPFGFPQPEERDSAERRPADEWQPSTDHVDQGLHIGGGVGGGRTDNAGQHGKQGAGRDRGRDAGESQSPGKGDVPTADTPDQATQSSVDAAPDEAPASDPPEVLDAPSSDAPSSDASGSDASSDGKADAAGKADKPSTAGPGRGRPTAPPTPSPTPPDEVVPTPPDEAVPTPQADGSGDQPGR